MYESIEPSDSFVEFGAVANLGDESSTELEFAQVVRPSLPPAGINVDEEPNNSWVRARYGADYAVESVGEMNRRISISPMEILELLGESTADRWIENLLKRDAFVHD